MSALPPPAAGPVPAAPPESRWAIVRRMFRRNRPAVWGLRIVVLLVLLAIYAPLLACELPLLWRAPSGALRSPWLERLFDVITWEHGVDRFFNSLLVTVTVGLLLLGGAALAGRARTALRGLRWYAAGALLLGLVQAAGWGLVRSLPFEDFAVDPVRQEQLADHALRWARAHLKPAEPAEAAQPAEPPPPLPAVWPEDPEGLRALAQQVRAWADGKPEKVASDPLAAAGALDRAARGREAAARGRAAGEWLALRTPVPYGAGDQRGGREEQFVEAFVRGDHPLGTDLQGRDVLARILYGTRISLTIGIVAVSIYVFIGTVLGALAGYFGRRTDLLIMRVVEIVISLPSLFLIMMIVALTENRSIFLIMVAIGLVGWTGICRLVRGQFLRERELDYVTAARSLGLPTHRIIFRHVLPNALSPVLVSATFGVASAILTENTLAFLGLGDITVPSWGRLLDDGRLYQYWHLILPPSVAIFVTITALNLVGDGVRDALDPKLRN